MYSKYTLIFKDPKLENVFQDYVNENIRIPLFKKIIISSTILTIIDILQKLAKSSDNFLNRGNLIIYGGGIVLEICFLLIYHLKPQYIKYALLFYNHLLIAQYTQMEAIPVSQQLVYTVGIMIYQIVNALFGEFLEAVYQTVVFGTFYLVMGLRNDTQVNFNLIALILTAMIILISAFYENIRALRSQFKLGKIDNQWELIFKSLVSEKEYMVFYYDEKCYSFKLNQQCISQNVSNTIQLRKYLRQIKIEKQVTLEQFIFEKINKNVEQTNIINKEVSTILNNKKGQVLYSIFYGFHTIILLQLKNYCDNKRFKEDTIEKLYQWKYKQFLAKMLKLVRKFSLKQNSLGLIYRMRKYCIYTHLKEMIIKNGEFAISESQISEINFMNIRKTLQFLFIKKKIGFQNLIESEVLGCKEYILIILIEIIEITLSSEIHIRFEQDCKEGFIIKVYCSYSDKLSGQLKQRVSGYLPLLLDIQFLQTCIVLRFVSYDSREQILSLLQKNLKRNQMETLWT